MKVTWLNLTVLCLLTTACTHARRDSDWARLVSADGKFSVEYPESMLRLDQGSRSIRLTRQVLGPARTPFCDFKGTAEPTTVVVDFDYELNYYEVADTTDVVQSSDPWRLGPVSFGGLHGVETRIGTEGCGPRIISLFVDATHVLEIRGIRLAELRTLESRGLLFGTTALHAAEVDSLLNVIVGSFVDLE
jgi:hypothetical protein